MLEKDDPRFLTDLMDLLSPRGVGTTAKSSPSLDNMPIDERVRVLLVDKTKTFDQIKKEVENYYTAKKTNQATPAEQDSDADLPNNFHGISTKDPFPICEKKGFKDSKYWLQNAPKNLSTPSTLTKAIFGDIFDDTKCTVSIFVSTDPYLSPAAAATEDVELFLNYTPPIVANQMIPYLEVEFASNKAHNNDPSFNHLSTPSLLRFLLGSVPWFDAKSDGPGSLAQGFSAADSALITVKQGETNAKGQATSEVISGMELFLSPQSLTNVETIKSSKTRLMNVKPFIPFASINNFEVQILNAGAGAMAHKKGKLTLTVHDKSRISEMSEFFRGPAGYATLKVWTSYGWIAPRRPDSEIDSYAKFINETMHAEDCWQVMNTQFSFDQAGKVSITLDLVGFGVSQAKRTAITVAKGYQAFVNGFNDTLEEIQEAAKDIMKLPLGPDARITQVLNAASSGGMLPADLKPEQFEDVMKSVSVYAQTAGLSTDETDKLVAKIRNVLDPKKYKAGLARERANSLKSLLTEIKGYDPFIAGPANANNLPALEQFFNPELIKEIDFFYTLPLPPTEEEKKTPPADNKKDEKEIPRPVISIDKDKKVISFGKLFCAVAVPAILEANRNSLKSNQKSELQIMFYALNDQCGPVSGQSVAEFPIDVERLAYALDDTIRAKSKTSDLTIEEFLKVVINSQFTDDRAIGYGMLSKNLFAPFDKDKPGAAKAEKNKEYESKMAEWQSQYPVFAKPVIEMLIETSKVEKNTATRIHELTNKNRKDSTDESIMRVHIYDKQNNPRKLFTQVASLSGKLFVGSFDDRELRRKLSKKSLTKEQLQALVNDIRKDRNSGEAAAAAATGLTLKGPAGEDSGIPIEAKLFGEGGVRENLRKLAPTLEIGTNGTLIKSANLQSKTDDLMAAANLVNIMKSSGKGSNNSTDPPGTGLEGPGGLPLRTVPASLSMTMMGCPAARLYQQYFVDLGTGTSLDNLYTCTQVTHKIDPGKFETSMTFAFSDGYGKYSSPPTIASILTNAAKQLKRAEEAANQPKPPNSPKATTAGKGAKSTSPATKAGGNKAPQNIAPENPPRPPARETTSPDPLPGKHPFAS